MKSSLPVLVALLAEVTQCAKDALCLVLTGFEHMGAGDVDCSAPR